MQVKCSVELVVAQILLPFLLSGMQTWWLELQQPLRTMRRTWVLDSVDLPYQCWPMHLQISSIWGRKKSPCCISHYFFFFFFGLLHTTEINLNWCTWPWWACDYFFWSSLLSGCLPLNWQKDGTKISRKKITTEYLHKALCYLLIFK